MDSLKEAQELHLADFAKIATGLEDYIFPPTLNQSAIANLLVDSTPGGMIRAVITCLLATGPLPKTSTTPLDTEQEGLSCAAFIVSYTEETVDEPHTAATIAPVVTRKGKQRMLHPPQTHQGSKQSTPPGTPRKMPPPTPVVPPPRTRPKGQRNPGTLTKVTPKGKRRTRHRSPTPQNSKSPPSPRAHTRKPKDQSTPEPLFPTQETATSADTALSQGEHQGPYPTMVQRIADLLRKPQELLERQREDPHLLRRVQDLNNGGTGGEYVTNDDGLLWYAPPGSILRLAIPSSLVAGILAFVHTTYGHPGVARTTELTQRKYHWASLKRDIRDYVLSCGCRTKDPPTNESPCYQLASLNPGKS